MRNLTGVTIRLSNDEVLKGDIIEDQDGDIVLKTKSEILRIPRGSVAYITEQK